MRHSYFCSEGDPCKARYKNQDKPFRNMISMTFSFYKQISLHKITTIITALYYIGRCTLIGQLVSAEVALKFALIALLSFFFVLPVIRYIAEMAEHDYMLSDTELGSTFNNLSFIDRWLFHPAADGYHLLHHFYPAIPFWNHKKAHKYLMERDCKYRNGFHRTSSLDKVKSLLEENR